MTIYSLDPVDGHKSFYGKAKIEEWAPGLLVLRSYKTAVAAIVDGELVRLWEGYSATTLRHVKAFAALAGVKSFNKKDWDALKLVNPSALGVTEYKYQ